LIALRIGAGVPSESFSGYVRSVFANAAILKIENKLVTLAPAAAGGLPAAINIDVPTGFDFARLLTAGAAAALRGGILRFADDGASIDLRGANPWRSRLGELALDFARPGTANGWGTAAVALRADGRSNAIARIGHGAIVKLSEATRRFDLHAAGQGAERLVGLGAGGTPAGDDLLVGYLAGLWASVGGDRPRTGFAAGLADLIRGLGERTNDVSRIYLEAAAEGEVSERLADVVRSIAEGEARPIVTAAAAAAIAVGHSSGADGILGLLLGLAAWGPNPIFRDAVRLVDSG
jgi:hypothetical protein